MATEVTLRRLSSAHASHSGALRRLGPEGAPHLHRLLAEGVSTLNARTEVEQTKTLPNHTSMVTGRRIEAAHDGHGVTWNTHRPGTTVQKAARHEVASIFSVVHAAGAESALFAAKTKFSHFKRSWPAGIDRLTIEEERDGAVVRAARDDLLQHDREFTFLHLGGADAAGHDDGFMTPAYLSALRRVDARIGKLLQAIDSHPSLDDLVVVLTSDHGGSGEDHFDPDKRFNYRVPFVVWGPGIAPGDLYDLNPAYADPDRERVGYSGPQPIRNGDVANLVTDLLDLPPVPGSEFNRPADLDVHAPAGP